MLRTLLITIAIIALFALYKVQHIRPVDNPKDSPLFQQRLLSSLKRFQEGDIPDWMKNVKEQRASDKTPYPTQPPFVYPKELKASGRCGTIYLTWVEEKKIPAESIQVKRKTAEGTFLPLKDKRVYEREETSGTRYWVIESGLANDQNYEYLISYLDEQGKESVKGPISLSLTCTEKDKELLARQQQMAKDYYQKMIGEAKGMPSSPPSPALTPTLMSKDLIVYGSCGRATLTWSEEKGIVKESIAVKRKGAEGEYNLIEKGLVYERAMENGVRYWVSDSGLNDGTTYEYLVSFRDANGKEVVRGPATLTLTCTDKDRELLALREQAIREYYQKRGIDYDKLKSSPYQLGEKVHNIDIGNAPRKGRPDAPITLVVFTDFECIHCATWARTLDEVLKTFPDEVAIVFKNFPLSYHKNAELAARAALAAGEQGKFWEMHDMLFKNQNALAKDDILRYAQSLKLDLSSFKSALGSLKVKNVIEDDRRQGQTLGVKNTPTTFINGRDLIGSPPLTIIEKTIEDILKSINHAKN